MMEGSIKQTENFLEGESREDKIVAAAKGVSETFRNKLDAVLSTIEENPYFQGAEERF